MVNDDCPGVLAMKVSVTTAPWPETPPAPGGRVAVTCSVPVEGSSRCTSATAWPSCDRNPPLETLTTGKLVGVVVELQGYGVHVLSAGEHDVDGKGRALGLRQSRRIKEERTRGARSAPAPAVLGCDAGGCGVTGWAGAGCSGGCGDCALRAARSDCRRRGSACRSAAIPVHWPYPHRACRDSNARLRSRG